MWDWSALPTKAEQKCLINEEPTFNIADRYYVTVHKDGTVSYRNALRHGGGDPRSTLPNMSIEDGQIKIVIEDLVPLILSRLEPADVAKELWQNAEVRDALMDCLATRWAEYGITDTDRRAFIAKVQEAVWTKAMDDLAHKLRYLEYEMAGRFVVHSFVDEVNRICEAYDIRRIGADRKPGELVQLRHPMFDEMVKIGGKDWHAAREYWHERLSDTFKKP